MKSLNLKLYLVIYFVIVVFCQILMINIQKNKTLFVGKSLNVYLFLVMINDLKLFLIPTQSFRLYNIYSGAQNILINSKIYHLKMNIFQFQIVLMCVQWQHKLLILRNYKVHIFIKFTRKDQYRIHFLQSFNMVKKRKRNFVRIPRSLNFGVSQ